ncbi:hypothetical protein ACFY4C_31450 [Actinomadura viridis]|uniref:hypothetical protein n=1 Tax=Actinomadura viridis TaxID=58110 RepID=UPI0036C6F1D1
MTAHAVKAVRRCANGAASFQSATDQRGAYRLGRAAHAVFVRQCTEGIDSPES